MFTRNLVKVKNITRPRILLGPQEISGYYSSLERGFLDLGVPARLVTTHPHTFQYQQSRRNPFFARIASWAVLKHRESSKFVKSFWALLYVVSSFFLMLWAVFRFDVFIFAWGTSFLPWNLDIPFFRLFGKKVYVVLGHGSEARPPYMSAPPHSRYPSNHSELKKLRTDVRRVAASVRRNERFASAVIGMQMTGQFLTKSFIDFYRLGLPTPLTQTRHATSPESGFRQKNFVVLHVPSNRGAKGSDEIQSVMHKITQKFSDVEYRELSGVSHSEIVDAMAAADLIIDQLWSDIPMAMVGTEAAALGKPTIISGYGWPQWEEWARRNGEASMPPVIRATPSTLKSVVENAIANKKATAQVGLNAKEFVEKVWSPTAVAAKYLSVIAGKSSERWALSPEEVSYLWGAGVSQENVLRMVNALMKSGGSRELRWPIGASFYSHVVSDHNTSLRRLL